jgi:transcriptional regulator
MPRDILDPVQNTIDFVILKTLSWGPMHGYAIAKWIRDTTHDELTIEEGTLYPALHRLEEKELIEAEWGLSDSNRRAKFYSLTREGRAELKSRVSRWQRYAAALDRILTATARA